MNIVDVSRFILDSPCSRRLRSSKGYLSWHKNDWEAHYGLCGNKTPATSNFLISDSIVLYQSIWILIYQLQGIFLIDSVFIALIFPNFDFIYCYALPYSCEWAHTITKKIRTVYRNLFDICRHFKRVSTVVPCFSTQQDTYYLHFFFSSFIGHQL